MGKRKLQCTSDIVKSKAKVPCNCASIISYLTTAVGALTTEIHNVEAQLGLGIEAASSNSAPSVAPPLVTLGTDTTLAPVVGASDSSRDSQTLSTLHKDPQPEDRGSPEMNASMAPFTAPRKKGGKKAKNRALLQRNYQF